ncbi:hypothetical protein BGZ60DRAFT_265402 [Tricladium varicosporioides]|nr:hypothetical protein BGZ60DRAFT_265402 [Hymenoscyphus varicosporioides]
MQAALSESWHCSIPARHRYTIQHLALHQEGHQPRAQWKFVVMRKPIVSRDLLMFSSQTCGEGGRKPTTQIRNLARRRLSLPALLPTTRSPSRCCRCLMQEPVDRPLFHCFFCSLRRDRIAALSRRKVCYTDNSQRIRLNGCPRAANAHDIARITRKFHIAGKCVSMRHGQAT